VHESREEKNEIRYKGGNFMRKFLGLLLTGILLFCTIFSIGGCGGESPLEKGTMYTLGEVYESGGIDRTALLNIAYHSGNAEHNPDEIGEDFVPIEKGELSEEISLEIREYLAERARTDEENPRYANYEITQYYGCYNGYYAVVFEDLNEGHFDVWEEYWTEVDGVIFYSAGYSSEKIYMWKRG